MFFTSLQCHQTILLFDSLSGGNFKVQSSPVDHSLYRQGLTTCTERRSPVRENSPQYIVLSRTKLHMENQQRRYAPLLHWMLCFHLVHALPKLFAIFKTLHKIQYESGLTIPCTIKVSLHALRDGARLEKIAPNI